MTLTTTEARWVLAAVAEAYGTTAEMILRSGNKRRDWVQARATVAIILRDRGYSLPDIGFALCRHHATVLRVLRSARPVASYTAAGVLRYHLTPADAPSAAGTPGIGILQHADGGMFHEGEEAA